MKHLKRSDGYVLPYVLVVFAILSLVAVSICSVALNNLRAQEAAVQRSQDLYEAEGEVERLVTKTVSLPFTNTDPSHSTLRNQYMGEVEDAIGIENCCVADPAADNAFVLTLKRTSVNGNATIDARVRVELSIVFSHSVTTGEGENARTTTYYKVGKVLEPAYQSYDISYNTVEEPEGGAE